MRLLGLLALGAVPVAAALARATAQPATPRAVLGWQAATLAVALYSLAVGSGTLGSVDEWRSDHLAASMPRPAFPFGSLATCCGLLTALLLAVQVRPPLLLPGVPAPPGPGR